MIMIRKPRVWPPGRIDRGPHRERAIVPAAADSSAHAGNTVGETMSGGTRRRSRAGTAIGALLRCGPLRKRDVRITGLSLKGALCGPGLTATPEPWTTGVVCALSGYSENMTRRGSLPARAGRVRG